MTDLDGAGVRDSSAAAGPDPDSVREEAERLVAAGLAAVSMAADRIGAPTRERGGPAAAGFDALGDMLFGRAGHRRHSVANGSPECCRCPVCRAIAAAREPSPEFAETVAAGFGTLAQGAARLLRGVADLAGPGTPADAGPGAGPDAGPASGTGAGDAGPDPQDDPWAAATAEQAGPARPGGAAGGAVQ